MFVAQRMTANPFTVTSGSSVPEAQEVMASHGVRHLPVVDDGAVVGVISKNDIRAALPSQATTLSAPSIAASGINAGRYRDLVAKVTRKTNQFDAAVVCGVAFEQYARAVTAAVVYKYQLHIQIGQASAKLFQPFERFGDHFFFVVARNHQRKKLRFLFRSVRHDDS